jgi:L-threonylcarbamoyladenylate synthase
MMKAERIAFDQLLSSTGPAGQMCEISSRINSGEIIVYPTETIYGVGGIFGNSKVFDGIIKAKKRLPDNPMILIASERSFFDCLDVEFPERAERLAEKFWPGLLTIIVPSASDPRGIGIRVSDHPFISELFKFIDKPLYSTSANLSSEPYNPDPSAIYSVFCESTSFMIDAGWLPSSAPSTIVRVTSENVVSVIREGTIKKELISEYASRAHSRGKRAK